MKSILAWHKCVNFTFENCYKLAQDGKEFTAEDLMSVTVPDFKDKNRNFFAKKNFWHALSMVSNFRVISCKIKPRFVGQFELDQNFYTITALGKLFYNLPPSFRVLCFYIASKRNTILPVLGVLSAVHFLKNAYEGALVVSGWAGYTAGFILCYLMFLGFKRLIS